MVALAIRIPDLLIGKELEEMRRSDATNSLRAIELDLGPMALRIWSGWRFTRYSQSVLTWTHDPIERLAYLQSSGPHTITGVEVGPTLSGLALHFANGHWLETGTDTSVGPSGEVWSLRGPGGEDSVTLLADHSVKVTGSFAKNYE